MASQWQWITDSTAVYTAPPAQALTTAPTLAALQIPPWGLATTAVPQPSAVGTPMPPGWMTQPYIYPIAPPATLTAAGPTLPIPPGPPSQPTPPPSAALKAPGPQGNTPMGPFGPGAGGMGAGTITSTLPNGTHGVAYTAQLAGAGGVPPYTWAATGLPSALTLSGSTISGTAAAAGTSTVTLTMTDSATPANVATRIETLVMA